EVSGAAFGQRERGVRHSPQLHSVLRAGGGDGALEVAPGLVGVEALSGTRTEYRQCGRLVFGLVLELLIGAPLERLNGLQAAALFDADLALLGGHARQFYGLGSPNAGVRAREQACSRPAAQALSSRRGQPTPSNAAKAHSSALRIHAACARDDL